jgi:hypothetical protein
MDWSGRRESNPRMQLGKLDASQQNQADSYKTASSAPQSHQRVSGETQNLNEPDIEPEALSSRARALLGEIDSCSNDLQLDGAARSLWGYYGEGAISDSEAAFLASCIDRRRPVSRKTAPGFGAPLGNLDRRVQRRFASRQHPRSPDRKASRDRRRMLGGSSAMPDNLRHHYTEGQRAVLCIIAFEVKLRGVCDLPIDKIAALAGVCRTTVQTTLHEARQLGHLSILARPRRGRKNLTNLVRISSPAWLAWIMRGPSAARLIGSNPIKIVSPTKIKDLRRKALCKDSSDDRPSPCPSLTGEVGRYREG